MEGDVTMKHTPGPWELNEQDRTVYIPSGPNSVIAAYGGTLANAQLIAQAPTLKAENQELKAINAELLEACRDAYGYMLRDLGQGPIVTRALGEAIARAEE